MSPKTAEVLAALRRKQEGITIRDGASWGIVYLDNAKPREMTPRQFAGHLSVLQRAGLYISGEDDCFGDVRMDQPL